MAPPTQMLHQSPPMITADIIPKSTETSCLCPHLVPKPTHELGIAFYPPLDKSPSVRSINQMPVEMLCEIFTKFVEVEYCSKLCPSATECSESMLHGNPVTLGQVCAYWRNVAVTTTSLWSTIHVISDPKQLSAQMHWTKLLLARAGTAPLDLVLKDCISRPNVCSSVGSGDIHATRAFLTLFISRVHQWRSIDFHLSLEVLDILFALTTSPMLSKCNNLRSASIVVSQRACNKLSVDQLSTAAGFFPEGAWADPFLAASWMLLLTSRNLKEFTWWPGFEGVFSNTHDVVFSHLTRLNVHYAISVEELLRVLVYFPNIKEVCVSNLRLPSPWEGRPPPLPLASLQRLQVDTKVEIGSLFDGLVCPALQTLELNYFGPMKTPLGDAISLCSFLQGSDCRLYISSNIHS